MLRTFQMSLVHVQKLIVEVILFFIFLETKAWHFICLPADNSYEIFIIVICSIKAAIKFEMSPVCNFFGYILGLVSKSDGLKC